MTTKTAVLNHEMKREASLMNMNITQPVRQREPVIQIPREKKRLNNTTVSVRQTPCSENCPHFPSIEE
jgi:hypothetical protein